MSESIIGYSKSMPVSFRVISRMGSFFITEPVLLLRSGFHILQMNVAGAPTNGHGG